MEYIKLMWRYFCLYTCIVLWLRWYKTCMSFFINHYSNFIIIQLWMIPITSKWSSLKIFFCFVLGIPKSHWQKSRKYSWGLTTGKNSFIESSVSKCATSWCKIHLLGIYFALFNGHAAINVLTMKDKMFDCFGGKNL